MLFACPIWILMKADQILDQISEAENWLPITTVRCAFMYAEAVTPVLLDKVQKEIVSAGRSAVRDKRLAAFGMFFLAQHGNARLFDALIHLFETHDPWKQDEWLFSRRLFFFGHRLLAECALPSERSPVDVALDPKLKPLTRSLAVATIGLQAAYGFVSRKQAVHDLRRLFNTFKEENIQPVMENWALTACKMHSRKFEQELLWCLSSNRMGEDLRPLVNASLQTHPDTNFASILPLESPVDLMHNVFPRIIRDGEVGFNPNAEIPNLGDFAATELYQSGN